MKRCRGCGAVLQSEDIHALGYTPKPESAYCRRCFRLQHYDDLEISMKRGIPSEKVMEQIKKTEALLLWVVDLFDFEAGISIDIPQQLQEREIVLVCSKRDLLPAAVQDRKLYSFIRERLKQRGISVSEIFLLSAEKGRGIKALRAYIAAHALHHSVLFFGRANSGKSTLINRLMGENILTCSRYPGTTLEQNSMSKDGLIYIDTPGIESGASMIMLLEESSLRQMIPTSRIKPEVYQVYEPQSFAVGGLVRLDLYALTKASVVFYCGSQLNIHRGSLEGADALWEKHYGTLLRPVPLTGLDAVFTMQKGEDKMDVVIDGLGWACISGSPLTVTVHVAKHVNVTFRKAMI